MKKLLMVLMAVCLIAALGATSFAFVERPANAAGHVGPEDSLSVNATGNYLFVCPYAAIKVGTVVPAILEGDGEHLVATGSVPYWVGSNCNVKVSVTASEFVCQADVADKHNQFGGNYRGEERFNKITPQLSSDGTNFTPALNITNIDQDEWTAEGKKVYFQFTAPFDQENPWVLNNIDELHAGWYKGTISFLVTQIPERDETALIGVEKHDHQELADGDVVAYPNN